mgnify:FL=1|tara:strand:- start:2095 stop:4173 length:2079 start_codon:yes stop_codon:yes gene_type:complete
MRKIIPEIFTKKLLFLFIENRKKTFNLKQIRYYLNSVIDIKNLKNILYDFVKRGYLISSGNDKFIFNRNLDLLVARIKKRNIVDLETGVEFKPRRRELKGVFDNELVYYFIDRKSNVRIFCHKNREEIRYVGKVIEENGRSYVKVPKKDYKIIVNEKQSYENELVVVIIKDWIYENPDGKILKSLGDEKENNTQIHAILEEFSLPYVFPKNVLKEAKNLKVEENKKRKDYTKELTFTIDPVDAKDFDDAISFKKIKENYEIGIHIADVSHYVTKDSVIDKEAVRRATSVYLSDRVVPMLPEVLSNDKCSLNPHEEKNVFSVYITFNSNFKIINKSISKSKIISNERFSYEEAQFIIEKEKNNIPKELTILNKEKKVKKEIADAIVVLNKIAESLKIKRSNNGSIFFNKEEVRFKVNNKGEPTGYYVKKQKKANFLVEEFMLLANVTVADKIIESKRRGVFRVHDKPDEKKIAEIESFIKRLGYNINISNSKEPNKAINKLLKIIEGKPEKNIIDMMVIRAMSKAKYSSQNIGHFGLMFDNYTHFTSPIRRYPDLIVHRIINDIINNKTKSINELESLCLHCSLMEEKATKAERASIKLMQVKYLSNKVGETFHGVVSGINERGLFVVLNKNKCEGFVRMKDIPGDFYNFDRKSNTIIGQNTLAEYSLGDNVIASVLSTNIEKKHIDLKLLDY